MTVGILDLFSGSEIVSVDSTGRCAVPKAIRAVVQQRSEIQRIMLGSHEIYPCLSAYDWSSALQLSAKEESRRLREEAAGETSLAHHARLYRLFGCVEDTSFDRDGTMILPVMMLAKAQIEDWALFVGAGATFQIWNPSMAEAMGPEVLRELAAFHRKHTELATVPS